MTKSDNSILYELVVIDRFIDNRFDLCEISYLRNPKIGDVGYVVEMHKTPKLAYEVECSNENGETIWLEVLFPEEISHLK